MSAAAPAETGLFLDGLRCAGCVARVERDLRAVAGVSEAQVNHTTHRARVRFDPARVDVAALVERVHALGYEATPYDLDALERPAMREARGALVRLLVAAFLAANVMMISLALYLGTGAGIDPGTQRALRWVGLALSLPAATWCAAPFWRGAFSGLRRGEITIDLPVALGIGTAFGASLVGTLEGVTHVFLDSAAMIVFLILLGRTLERGGRARASRAVEQLVALAPATALLRRGDRLEEVAATSLVRGDRVVVAPGQAFPADGAIVRGATEVDEALLTGESLPVARGLGERVTGGSRNVLAEVEVEIRAAAREGELARLAALLERAQLERPQVQKLADRVAAVFAPAVLAITAVTALVWTLLGASPLDVAMTAAAVLIVACPCALGLATPAAMTAALGRGARFGLLFKSGEAIERCAAVDTVLLDKTGTLSEGRLAIARIVAAAGVAEATVLAHAVAIEGASTHPVAEALRRELERRGLAPAAARETRRAVAGRGVIAENGAQVDLVGTRALLHEYGVAVEDELARAERELARSGASLAWVASSGTAIGLVALVDPLRADARDATHRMKALGLDVALISGDHADAVALAAAGAGIDAYFAGVLPEEKVEHVRKRRAAGAHVLMAGDGINDAAALAAADVGLAMGRGAEVAVHAADIVVRAPRVGAIADAVGLARATLRRVRENLAVAVLYNAVAIPLAALGWLHPLPAAIAMSLSSVVVTGNAVRLLAWRAPR
jgi:Cu2+-exporting ATPase